MAIIIDGSNDGSKGLPDPKISGNWGENTARKWVDLWRKDHKKANAADIQFSPPGKGLNLSELFGYARGKIGYIDGADSSPKNGNIELPELLKLWDQKYAKTFMAIWNMDKNYKELTLPEYSAFPMFQDDSVNLMKRFAKEAEKNGFFDVRSSEKKGWDKLQKLLKENPNYTSKPDGQISPEERGFAESAIKETPGLVHEIAKQLKADFCLPQRYEDFKKTEEKAKEQAKKPSCKEHQTPTEPEKSKESQDPKSCGCDKGEKSPETTPPCHHSKEPGERPLCEEPEKSPPATTPTPTPTPTPEGTSPKSEEEPSSSTESGFDATASSSVTVPDDEKGRASTSTSIKKDKGTITVESHASLTTGTSEVKSEAPPATPPPAAPSEKKKEPPPAPAGPPEEHNHGTDVHVNVTVNNGVAPPPTTTTPATPPATTTPPVPKKHEFDSDSVEGRLYNGVKEQLKAGKAKEDLTFTLNGGDPATWHIAEALADMEGNASVFDGDKRSRGTVVVKTNNKLLEDNLDIKKDPTHVPIGTEVKIGNVVSDEFVEMVKNDIEAEKAAQEKK